MSLLTFLQVVLHVLFPVSKVFVGLKLNVSLSTYTLMHNMYIQSLFYYPLLLFTLDLPPLLTVSWYLQCLVFIAIFFQRCARACEFMSLHFAPRINPSAKPKRSWSRKPLLRAIVQPEHRKRNRKKSLMPTILHPWRYLPDIGQQIAIQFEQLVTHNDALWELIRPNQTMFALSDRRSRTIPISFCLHGSDAVYDLTSVLKTNNLIRFQSVYHFKSDNGSPLIFDTGASITVTPHLSDFVDSKVDTDHSKMGCTHLNGINSVHIIKGIGKIRVLLYTDDGKPRYITTTGYYVPDINVRLLSVQRYLDEYLGQNSSFTLNDSGMKFVFPSSLGGGTLTFKFKESNFLPTAETYLSEPPLNSSSPRVFAVIDETNNNLTSGQKALLQVHFRLGHFNFRWLQHLIRHNFVRSTNDDQALKCDSSLCLCTACQFAKQRKR